MSRGVTLILAVLISSIALTLGVSISTLVLGEIQISGTAKESIIAFYAADSGAECALYWDIKHDVFTDPSTGDVQCANSTPDLSVIANSVSTTTQFSFSLPNKSCARVRIAKSSGGTTVTSLGENIDCGTASERSVQRGIEVTY